MIDLRMEIICKEFKHKRIVDGELIVDGVSEEYYIIPITKPLEMEYDEEIYRLTFENQLLWLKYSNHFKKIHIKDYDFKECIVIKSTDMLEAYIKIKTNNYFRKNVWSSGQSVYLNKKYTDKYLLALPIFDKRVIDIREFGEGAVYYQIHIITNEILLKKTIPRSIKNNSYMLNNNFLLNKEALFIELNDEDVAEFIN